MNAHTPARLMPALAGWGTVAYLRPHPACLKAGVALNAAVVAVWDLSTWAREGALVVLIFSGVAVTTFGQTHG